MENYLFNLLSDNCNYYFINYIDIKDLAFVLNNLIITINFNTIVITKLNLAKVATIVDMAIFVD